MSLALLFPGQGSQHVGMGTELGLTEPAAQMTIAEADEALGFPITELMADGPAEVLTETRYAQPAILTHSVAVHRVFGPKLGRPLVAAGHSLGEFSAHVAAGTLSFADALLAVKRRGELMYSVGTERPGTMAAVIGLSDEALSLALTSVSSGICVCANFNSPGQVVISGDTGAVEEAMDLMRTAGARRVLRLPVSGAFHSPLMGPAARSLSLTLRGIEFRDPEFAVISNVTAAPVTNGDRARELLVDQLTSPVRWSESVTAMLAHGADTFRELGPGRVLCGLNRRIARGVGCASLGGPSNITRRRD